MILKKIAKIAYNAELKTMYIAFQGSTVDTPFVGVSKKEFNKFSKAANIDEHFNDKIQGTFEEVTLDTEIVINCNLSP